MQGSYPQEQKKNLHVGHEFKIYRFILNIKKYFGTDLFSFYFLNNFTKSFNYNSKK